MPFDSVFKEPYIGNREFGIRIKEHLEKHNIIDSFSVYEAASYNMSDMQITVALRYLLWSELALYNQEVNHIDDVENPKLFDLYFGRDKDFAINHLKNIFLKGNIQVVNPLIYSAISEDLWFLAESFLKDALENDENRHVYKIIKNKMKKSSSFLENKGIIGYWVECYIRGAFALLSLGSPMITKVFRKAEEKKEVDIVSSIHNVLIECAVRDKDKNTSEVNFGLAGM
jgi:hypothetical protein